MTLTIDIAVAHMLTKKTRTSMEGIGSHYSNNDQNIAKSHHLEETTRVSNEQTPILIDY